MCSVASLEEKGLMPNGVLPASPFVSGTPPHKSHCEFLNVGFVGKIAFGIQPRVQLVREGLETRYDGDGNEKGKTTCQG